MSGKINLKTTVVESREQRLGTIIAWDGKASDLSKESNYSRGCGQEGGCRLCEIRGPFTQGSVCSEQMVECQAGNVRGAVLIQHSPIGCALGQIPYNSIYRNGLAIRNLPVESIRIMCSNLIESDMVFGGLEKLEQSIQDAWERYHPRAIFLGTSCATAIIGDDIDGIASDYEDKLGIPVIPLHCEGFKSKHWSTGFDSTQHGILRQIVKKKPTKKQEDLVNYVVDLATVEDLEQMSEAACTVGFCYTLSSYLAAGLEQEYGVPEIKAPQPYGFEATDAWIREIGRVTHREELAEKYIAKERKRITPRIEELRKQLKGLKGFVATGSAYAHGLISVLRELGIETNASLVFHHDPIYDSGDPKQDSLAYLVEKYGDVPSFSVSNRQQYQFYALLQRVHPDFILIRHNVLAPVASRLGIPAAPLGDEHIAIGYEGIVNLGETILDIVSRRKFHLDLAAHVKLPYKKWWLEQSDPYILAKSPELVEQ